MKSQAQTWGIIVGGKGLGLNAVARRTLRFQEPAHRQVKSELVKITIF